MRIYIDAEGDREQLRPLLTALGRLVLESLLGQVPLTVSLGGDLIDKVNATIVRKEPPA